MNKQKRLCSLLAIVLVLALCAGVALPAFADGILAEDCAEPDSLFLDEGGMSAEGLLYEESPLTEPEEPLEAETAEEPEPEAEPEPERPLISS